MNSDPCANFHEILQINVAKFCRKGFTKLIGTPIAKFYTFFVFIRFDLKCDSDLQ
jgi:hypothetical protein